MTEIYLKVIDKAIPLGILPSGIYSLPLGMDETNIRMERLRELLHSEYEGKQVLLSERLGRQADYISRILNGKKALSGDLAREFERLLGKPKYWLDGEEWVRDAGAATLSAQALAVAKAFDSLPDAEKPSIIRAVGATPTPREPTMPRREVKVSAPKKRAFGSS